MTLPPTPRLVRTLRLFMTVDPGPPRGPGDFRRIAVEVVWLVRFFYLFVFFLMNTSLRARLRRGDPPETVWPAALLNDALGAGWTDAVAAPESTPPFGPRYEAWRGDRPDVPYSVGNYWPYATTLYDYVYRAMPSNAPGTLEPNQVYGLVAWILTRNGIIADGDVMNAATLPAVEMPARGVFVPQER